MFISFFDVIDRSFSNTSVECCVTEEFLSKTKYPPAENCKSQET